MRKTINALLLLFLALFIGAAVLSSSGITGMTPHSQYPDLYSAAHDTTIDGQLLSTTDNAVYKEAWYSINGDDWQSTTLQGTPYTDSEDWLSGTATTTLPSSILNQGEHYVLTYTCTYNNGWDCHGDKWQLNIITKEPAEEAIAINAGTDETATLGGTTYDPDPITGGDTRVKDYDVPGTDEDELYQSYRLGDFTYELPAENGWYNITFHFIEPYHQRANARVFDVMAEGETIIDDLDIYAEAGYLAPLLVEEDVYVNDGALSLSFASEADLSLINGFKAVHDPERQPECTKVSDCYDGSVLTGEECVNGKCVYWDVCVPDGECPAACSPENDPDCEEPSILPEGLVSWWPLDGNAQDAAGNNHGTPSTGLTTTTQGCISGSCYLFDGDDDYITLALGITLSKGTYSFWIQRGEDQADDRIVLGKYGSYSRIFLRRENSLLRLETDTNQQEFQFYSDAPTTALTNVVLVRDGDRLELYLNGTYASYTTMIDASPMTFTQIGMDGRSFRGTIDEVMVWDRALAAAEVADIHAYFQEPVIAECGNGRVEPPETCDGNCPTSCDDGNPCTTDTMTGSPDECNVACAHTQKTSCQDNDGCCPSGCDYQDDNDCPEQGAAPILSIHSSGRYLVDQNGEPFFLNGDTPWSLIVQPSKEDAKYYLQSRKQSGFNAVQIMLIGHKQSDNPPKNHYGDAPFTDKTFTTPNEAYFAHADYVIDTATEEGFVILLAPLWLGWMCSSTYQQGWCSEFKEASESDMLAWGRYVGNRYKDYDNIIWIIGGDMDPTDPAITGDPAAFKSKIEKFVEGIQQYDPDALLTFHNKRGQLAVDTWPNANWLNVNNVYSKEDEIPAEAERAYEHSPIKPFFMIEGVYENAAQGITAQGLRAQAYRTILSGGFGHVFGNCPLFHFNAASCDNFCEQISWKGELDSEGTQGMTHFNNLFASLDWHLFVPDLDHTVLKSGYGTLGAMDYAAAASASDGSTIVAYLPTQRTVTVDTTILSGSQAAASWYNPRDGTTTSIGTSAQATSKSYTTPTSSGPDWVLVLRSAS
ncbi:DUF4038 domain-containing protein [Candidatus Woesearchaeota archaeon]|nr:DUF4038 domain-containing protein [Candidatus Woesearchaeota archaeon]